MLPATRRVVATVLKGRSFSYGLDLGCAEGLAGPLLKRHVRFLEGVDHNLGRLRLAEARGVYDRLVCCELQHYQIPGGVDSAFLFDVIEHMPKGDGYTLLSKLGHVPFVMLTTPERWHKYAFRNHHLSHWTQTELQGLGFSTLTFDCGLLGAFLGSRRSILAVKGF